MRPSERASESLPEKKTWAQNLLDEFESLNSKKISASKAINTFIIYARMSDFSKC